MPPIRSSAFGRLSRPLEEELAGEEGAVELALGQDTLGTPRF